MGKDLRMQNQKKNIRPSETGAEENFVCVAPFLHDLSQAIRKPINESLGCAKARTSEQKN